jgi:putative transposase
MSFESIPFKDLFLEPQRNGLTKPSKVRGSGLPMVNMGEIFAHRRIGDIEMELVPVVGTELRCLLHPGDLLFARQSLVYEGSGIPAMGKPWQHGTTESFNGKLRDECFSLEWFRNRIEARIVIADWRRHYNEVRPHSSLGYLTPLQMAQSLRNCLSIHAISQMAVV